MTHRTMRQVTATTAKRVLVIVDAELAQEGGPVPEGMTVVTVGAAPGAMEALPLLRIDCSGGAFPECPDALTAMQAAVCARRLSPFHDTGGADGATTTPGTWAQLTGIRDPERVSPELLWQPRAVERRLRVPIGVDDQGDPTELDIKEAAHGGTGPHGLCVGATGSGKSEFLRTLTLGLVATHPPEALNLVLVDFKGGATFLGFERLRHVAAVITNLADEAHLVLRMRDALAGELTRRQELLRAAGNFANVTAYEAARTHGAKLAPLPTLFIVVDEFSELLTQHPDFVELFVAIGRVGRSLGMHLLLASQRLEEGRLRGLESHLSYRICLKTFSAAESRAVLGTTAAFDLPNTPGGAYLKNASGELVRFRTAFVSGPMAAARRSDPSGHSMGVPTLFSAAPVGRVRKEGPPAGADPRSVLDAMLERLAEVGTRAHQVWLPPLAASPTLGAVLADASPASDLVVPIGLVDNPFQQRRDVLLADLRGAGGHVAVVGGPRSGKSTTVRTLILALAAIHDPATVQVYGLDFGGGTLSAVRALPHVGAVAGRFDRELVGRIVAHLQAVVRRREAQLRSTDTRHHGEVFLVIDGWAGVRQEFDGLEDAITAIAAQGLSVGVHVVIAASRWADLRPALKDQLGTRIELRLGDPADSELDRKRARLLAERPAGHGITRDGLELVVALPRLDSVATAHGLDDALRTAADALRLRHRGMTAPEVAPMPTRVAYEGVVAQAPAQVVLGLGGDELRPMTVDFTESLHALILGEPQCGKTSALRTLCRELVRTNDPGAARLVVVDLRRTLLGVVETEHLGGYAGSAAAAEAHLTDLAVQLTARLPDAGVTQRQLRERSWWSGPDMYVVVDDYELVAGAARNPLTPLLELLPHARDLGLHVIVARRAGGAARAMFDPVLTGLRDLGCLGLMMSATPDEGVLLGSVRPSPLPQGRATVIRRGHPDQLVQVAWTAPP
jgi:S-DNA-T family DNA segregation ATPase FtsK/SpoIIIE